MIREATVNAAPGEGGRVQRLQVLAGGVSIKIEVSPVLRGSVIPAAGMSISDSVASQFGYIETLLLALRELFAGKLVAALDRQHPRDLFDVMLL